MNSKRQLPRVFVLGDSISIHYGPSLRELLRGTMEYSRKGDPPEQGDAEDANGGDSSMVLEFLNHKEESGGIAADILLLNCGLHDIKTDPLTGQRQVELQQYRDNLRAIVETTGRMGLKLIWVRTTPCNNEAVHNNPGSGFHRFAADCDAYNRAADEIMKERAVPSVDLYTFTVELGNDVYCDHVHFHEHIQEKQAAFLAQWLIAHQQSCT